MYNDEPNVLNTGLYDLSSFYPHHKMVKLHHRTHAYLGTSAHEYKEKR